MQERDDDVRDGADGGPGTITLGGKEWLVAQCTMADAAAIRNRLKKSVPGPLEMYAELAGNKNFRLLPKDVRRELAKEAGQLTGQKQKVLTPEMANEMLMEPEHCRFLAWILLRKLQPELRLDELTPLITEDNAAIVSADLAKESRMGLLGN